MNQQPKEPDDELPLVADHPNQLSFLDVKPKDEPKDKQ